MVGPDQEIDYMFYETPEYLAPEIFDGEMPSKSADFWSFGVLIYQIMFGKLPFED